MMRICEHYVYRSWAIASGERGWSSMLVTQQRTSHHVLCDCVCVGACVRAQERSLVGTALSGFEVAAKVGKLDY